MLASPTKTSGKTKLILHRRRNDIFQESSRRYRRREIFWSRLAYDASEIILSVPSRRQGILDDLRTSKSLQKSENYICAIFRAIFHSTRFRKCEERERTAEEFAGNISDVLSRASACYACGKTTSVAYLGADEAGRHLRIAFALRWCVFVGKQRREI